MGRYILTASIPFFLYLFGIVASVSAAFSVSNVPSAATSGQEMEVNVELSLQGQDNKKYYLEGAIKKDDGSNYFGLTFNDIDWVGYTSSSFSNLKAVTTDASGSWSGSLRFKVDPTSPYYKGSGNYIFQVKRFTEAGSSSWSDNTVTLAISGADPSVAPSTSPNPSSQPAGTVGQAGFVINTDKGAFNSSDSLNISVQLSGQNGNSKFYLKPALTKSGSSNYFGLTKVGSSWIKNSQSYSDQLAITTDASGSWSVQIEFKVDPDDSGFTGTGEYILKVGRYSASGSGPTWSPELVVNITDNTPRTTASPKASSSPSSTKTATASPTTKGSPSGVNQTIFAASSGSFYNNSLGQLPKIGSVAGESTKSAENVLVKSNQQLNWIVMAIGGGLLLVSAAAGFYYFKIK